MRREHLDHCRPVGFVLDQFRYSSWPLCRELHHSLHSGGAVHPSPNLVAEHVDGTETPPDLPDHVVRRVQVLERTIPGLEAVINPVRYFDGADRHLRSIRQRDDDGRKVGSPWLPISEPMAFENTATGGRGPLLKLACGRVAAQTTLERFDFRRPEAFSP